MDNSTNNDLSAPIFRYLASTVLALLFLGGCASVPPGSAVIQQQAVKMVPPDGWGAIYVFRPRMPPGDTLWGVNLDAKHFGYLAPGTYLYGIVEPGQHSLDLKHARSNINFVVGKDENHFFKISPGFPGMILKEIDSTAAKPLLHDFTASSFNIFENDRTHQLLNEQNGLNNLK